jgi:hypothetical protein
LEDLGSEELADRTPPRLGHVAMNFGPAHRVAAKTFADVPTLQELKEAVRHVRALTPHSPLADLAEMKISAIETALKLSMRLD